MLELQLRFLYDYQLLKVAIAALSAVEVKLTESETQEKLQEKRTESQFQDSALQNEHKKYLDLLAGKQEELLKQQEKLLAHIAKSSTESPSRKDGWDRLAAIAPMISASIIAVGGACFTMAYNQAQLRLQEVQTIERFIPHLLGDEKSKRAAVLAISQIADPALAGKVAAIFASPGTVSALESIAANNAQTGDSKSLKKSLAKALDNMAETYKLDHQYDEAIGAYKRALLLQEQSLGAKSPELIPSMNRLAEIYVLHKNFDEAEDLLRRALDIAKAEFGANSMDYAGQLRHLASLYKEEGQQAKAQSVFNQALAIEQKVPGGMAGSAGGNQAVPSGDQYLSDNNSDSGSNDSSNDPNQAAPANADGQANASNPMNAPLAPGTGTGVPKSQADAGKKPYMLDRVDDFVQSARAEGRRQDLTKPDSGRSDHSKQGYVRQEHSKGELSQDSYKPDGARLESSRDETGTL